MGTRPDPRTQAARPRRGRLAAVRLGLYAVDYDQWISIEHEDRRFEGDEELVKRGFLLAGNTLRPLIV